MVGENQKKNEAIERFFSENQGLMPNSVERLIKEIMGEYANGDSVLLQKSELQEAFSAVLKDSSGDKGSADGVIGQTERQKIIDAVEQVKAASSLSEKAVSSILDIFDEMRVLIADLDQDDVRKELNAKISGALELCTFEDIASQHMGKALKLMQQTCSDNPQDQQPDDGLLSGPSINEGDGMSQEDIDKLLNG